MVPADKLSNRKPLLVRGRRCQHISELIESKDCSDLTQLLVGDDLCYHYKAVDSWNEAVRILWFFLEGIKKSGRQLMKNIWESFWENLLPFAIFCGLAAPVVVLIRIIFFGYIP